MPSYPVTDTVLVLSIFFVASCGLAYELIAGALSSYLLGDTVLQFSSIIGCYLFAMGVGSHLSRHVEDRDLTTRFVDVELAVALFGGCSAALLFLGFAWIELSFRTLLYLLVFLIGVLVGMEIPLVMRMLHAGDLRFSVIVSRVLTFDYLGALAVSLLFPLVLAPYLGLVGTSFVFGIVNAAVGLVTLRLFRDRIAKPSVRSMRGIAVLFLLVLGLFGSARIVRWGEHGMYGDPIIHAVTTQYQRLVITRWKDDLRLYINGNLQFSSRDEHRYHEALIHPALASLPWARSVLVLGGGDGLALREILRYPGIVTVTLVDLDPAMTGLFSTAPDLVALNHGAFADPRVHLINADAAIWLDGNTESFDMIVADFPDPSNFSLGKLYSVPFYTNLRRHLSAHGLAVIQSTSPYFAPHAFWSIEATLREAGFSTWPYHAYVPSFGDWGFVIAATEHRFTPPEHYSIPLRFLNGEVTGEMFRFAPDMPHPTVGPNRLDDQALVHYFEEDWQGVIR
jgi:spermidine synthase